MKPINFKEAGPYSEIELLGRKMLLTELRVDRSDLPEGIYAYDLRHEDENWGNPCQIQNYALVNHYGCILTNKPIDLGEDGYIDFDTYKDFGFTDSDPIKSDDIVKYFSELKEEEQ